MQNNNNNNSQNKHTLVSFEFLRTSHEPFLSQLRDRYPISQRLVMNTLFIFSSLLIWDAQWKIHISSTSSLREGSSCIPPLRKSDWVGVPGSISNRME